MARRRRLGEILVEAGMIDDFQLRSALSDQKRWGRPLGVTLVRLGFIEEDVLLRVLSQQLDMPIVDMAGKRIAPELLAKIPIELAEKHRCIPLFAKREGGAEVLYLGMEDPTDLAVVDDLTFRTGLKLRPVLVGPTQLTAALERHYHKLEWETEDDGEAGFETPVEPGDTAPLVYKPDRIEPAAPESVGTELLEQDDDGGARPEPAAPTGPPTVPDLAEASAPSDAGMDPRAAARAAEQKRPRSMDELGPEFIVDLPPPEPEPTAPEPAPAPPAAVEAPPPPAVAKPAAAEPPSAKPREVSTRAILRAVTHLLVEKGVITRAELMERIRAADPGDDDA
ncbi:MAG: hypothetical protein R3190_18955 [Thermoanaerobaculia bacterium]|nr:hypothetical protein [Thermoanaerobaculia bacterium]